MIQWIVRCLWFSDGFFILSGIEFVFENQSHLVTWTTQLLFHYDGISLHSLFTDFSSIICLNTSDILGRKKHKRFKESTFLSDSPYFCKNGQSVAILNVLKLFSLPCEWYIRGWGSNSLVLFINLAKYHVHYLADQMDCGKLSEEKTFTLKTYMWSSVL